MEDLNSLSKMLNSENQKLKTMKELSDAEMLRYSRQILLDEWDIEAQTRLKNSCAIIIGMGGLGCPLAETLCRAGIGQLIIIDNDTIDESNLQRQSLFTPKDIGFSKAFKAKEKLNEINDFCEVFAILTLFNKESFEEISTLLNKNSLSNLICDCTDNFSTRDQINQFSVKYKLPLLSASAIGQKGQLALFEPNQGCYHCLFQGESDDDRTCVNSGVLASTTQIIGNMQAQVALTFLGKGINQLSQTLLLWHGDIMQLKKLKYTKDTNCEICSRQ